MKARESPGCAGCVSDGQPCRQTEAFQPLQKIGEKCFFSAEEMCRARDIEKKTIGAVFLAPRRDDRRVACGPQRKATERGIVSRAIGTPYLQRLGFRPGVGQKIAGLKPFAFGGFV